MKISLWSYFLGVIVGLLMAARMDGFIGTKETVVLCVLLSFVGWEMGGRIRRAGY